MKEEEIRILVVDDNEDISGLISALLGEDGYSVTIRNGGESALALLESSNFDLLLLDVMMPGKSGFDVLADLKELNKKENREIPVIMVTAKSGSEDIDHALGLGATAYIIKPFRAELLRAKVREVLVETGKLEAAQ